MNIKKTYKKFILNREDFLENVRKILFDKLTLEEMNCIANIDVRISDIQITSDRQDFVDMATIVENDLGAKKEIEKELVGEIKFCYKKQKDDITQEVEFDCEKKNIFVSKYTFGERTSYMLHIFLPGFKNPYYNI